MSTDQFYQSGSFFCIDGPAKKLGKPHSNMKVCFICRDPDFLTALLLKIVSDEECWWVKMSTKPRDGMFLGRCFFTTKERAAETWAKFKTNPRFVVTLQDDDFSSSFREQVVSWKGKPVDSIG